MRKLLPTLRWLLVLLLPPLGLLAGLWLMPVAKARWQVTLESHEQCAGVIPLVDSRCLALYRERKVPGGTAVHEIVGLDLATGQPGFICKLPDPAVMMHIQLIPGTTLTMYFNRLDAHAPVKIYDWLEQQDVFEGVVREEYYKMRSVSYRNNVLAADMGGLRQGVLAFWHREYQKQPRETTLHLPDCIDYDLQLSPNGAWAIVHYTPSVQASGVLAGHQVQVIDTAQIKIVQSLPSLIQCIRWHTDEEAFLARQIDRTTNAYSWQRYVRLDGEFVPQGNPIPTYGGIVLKQSPSPFITLATTNKGNTMRARLNELMKPLGEVGQKALDHLWPVATSFNLFQINDGDLAHRVTMPEVEYGEVHQCVVHPDVLGAGLVLQKGEKLINMEFYPSNRWYPRIGLAFGLAFAILLAWRNLRRPARREPLFNKSSAT